MRRQDRCRVAEGLFDLRRQEVPHIVQPRAGEVGLGKIGPGEIGIIEHGTAQIRAGEIGVRQSRMREIGARQIRALEIGAGERGEAQRRAAEIGAPQDSAAEVGMIERGALQSRFAEIGVGQARMDKIGMCEIGGLQIGRRQRGETEHRLLQARRFQIDGRAARPTQFALACRKHDACEVRDGGRPLLAPGVPRLGPATQDFGMMTDRRQRCTAAATQLHSILSEIARRAST